MILEILTTSMLMIVSLFLYSHLSAALNFDFADLNDQLTGPSARVAVIAGLHNVQKTVQQLIPCPTGQQFAPHVIKCIQGKHLLIAGTLKQQAKNDTGIKMLPVSDVRMIINHV